MKYGLSLLVLLSVAGCSRDPASTTTGTTAATGNKAPVVEETVAAVLLSPAKASIALRFLLESKPVLGSPGRVRLDFSATDPVANLTLRAEGKDLSVDAAGASATISLPEAGKTVSHTVSVTPQAPGFSQLIVHAQPPGEGTAEIVYAIPLMTDAAAQPAAK